MLTETSLAVFKKIRVKITFRDAQYKDRAIAATCKIGFSENAMQILALKILEAKETGKYKELLESGEVPMINEENLHEILEFAKIFNVKWWLLMNITLDLKKTTSFGFKSRIGFFSGGSKNLILEVAAPQRLITIELQKKKFNAWTPSRQLEEIDLIIREHGSGKGKRWW